MSDQQAGLDDEGHCQSDVSSKPGAGPKVPYIDVVRGADWPLPFSAVYVRESSYPPSLSLPQASVATGEIRLTIPVSFLTTLY